MNLLFMNNGLAPYGVPRNGLVAIYDPGRQIITGTTGQTLIDYTGKGNGAQLGSTAEADTNDPSFSGAGLVFGIDDYLKLAIDSSNPFSDPFAFALSADMTKINAVVDANWQESEALATAKGGNAILGLSANTAGYSFYENYTKKGHIGMTISRAKTIMAAVKLADSVSTNRRRIVDRSSDTELMIGTYDGTPEFSWGGEIYILLLYNRALSDAEYMTAYNGLRRLMSARGITI